MDCAYNPATQYEMTLNSCATSVQADDSKTADSGSAQTNRSERIIVSLNGDMTNGPMNRPVAFDDILRPYGPNGNEAIRPVGNPASCHKAGQSA